MITGHAPCKGHRVLLCHAHFIVVGVMHGPVDATRGGKVDANDGKFWVAAQQRDKVVSKGFARACMPRSAVAEMGQMTARGYRHTHTRHRHRHTGTQAHRHSTETRGLQRYAEDKGGSTATACCDAGHQQTLAFGLPRKGRGRRSNEKDVTQAAVWTNLFCRRKQIITAGHNLPTPCWGGRSVLPKDATAESASFSSLDRCVAHAALALALSAILSCSSIIWT